MTVNNEKTPRILNAIILAALAVGCIGSILFIVCRKYLAQFPTDNF